MGRSTRCRRYVVGHRKVAAGNEIFRQGDVGTDFYVILHGSVNVLIKDQTTNADNVVATLYGGDSFGELALLQVGLAPLFTASFCTGQNTVQLMTPVCFHVTNRETPGSGVTTLFAGG